MSVNKLMLVSRLLVRNTRQIQSFQPAIRYLSSEAAPSRRSTLVKSVAIGFAVGTAYVVYDSFKPANDHKINEESDVFIIDKIPDVPIARKIVNHNDKSNLNLVLFQYQTCPFCCKVRAYLDANGFSYSVVEVDAVLRQSIKWSPYKKVPSLLARQKDGRYVQLTESSMIISALESYKKDSSQDIGALARLYPHVSYHDDKGKKKHDVLNKYFIMFNENTPKNLSKEDLKEERKWREWTDEHFIHLISPNVYRTYSEALETFNWFSDAGEWDEHFPKWERNMMVYVGATAMYLIAKRLKKRHLLSHDVRQHMYNACNKWTKTLEKKKSKFLGGKQPNLADLAFYGALNSMEGCAAFHDVLQNTKIEPWINAMREYVNSNKGLVVKPHNNFA